MSGDGARRPPVSLRAGRPLCRVDTPEQLAAGWWAGTVHFAGERVQRLIQSHEAFPSGMETCQLVPGVPHKLLRKLGLPTFSFHAHESILETILQSNEKLFIVDLGHGAMSLFQGIRVKDVYGSNSHVSH